MKFDGRTVMVTGASGNLGRAVAKAFENAGANLVLIDLHHNQLAKAFGAADARRVLIPTDLLDQQQVNSAVQAAIERFGRIDVLANIAGGFRMGDPVHQTTDADWNFLFDINARTLLHAVRAVVPRMIEVGGGKIVNVAAYSALRGIAGMGAYTAAKANVIRLTEALAAELQANNINVNCVLPTLIDTPENRAAMPKADRSRWVAPDDLANVILFLSSPLSRAIHGAAVPVGATS